MILPISFAILNRLRGSDFGKPYTNKVVTSLLCGVVAGGYIQSPLVGVIVALGTWLWAVFGWGEYFDFSNKTNDEIKLIDKAVYALLPPSQYADMLAMSLRGLFIYPMFAALAILGYESAWLYGFVGLLQGVVYWAAYKLLYKHDYVAYAEVAFGACVGLALQGVL